MRDATIRIRAPRRSASRRRSTGTRARRRHVPGAPRGPAAPAARALRSRAATDRAGGRRAPFRTSGCPIVSSRKVDDDRRFERLPARARFLRHPFEDTVRRGKKPFRWNRSGPELRCLGISVGVRLPTAREVVPWDPRLVSRTDSIGSWMRRAHRSHRRSAPIAVPSPILSSDWEDSGEQLGTGKTRAAPDANASARERRRPCP